MAGKNPPVGKVVEKMIEKLSDPKLPQVFIKQEKEDGLPQGTFALSIPLVREQLRAVAKKLRAAENPRLEVEKKRVGRQEVHKEEMLLHAFCFHCGLPNSLKSHLLCPIMSSVRG